MKLRELWEKTKARAERCHDDIAPSNQLLYDGSQMLEWPVASALFNGTEQAQMQGKLNRHAYGQLVGRLAGTGLQPRWLLSERCPTDLERHILNRLINFHPPADLLIRQIDREGDNIVRAVLSDSYTPIDNHTLMEMVVRAREMSFPDARVKVFNPRVGDTFRTYLLFPEIDFGGADWNVPLPPDRGGGLHPAIYLHNGEVGGDAIHITAGVYRAVCQNGVIYGWSHERSTRIVHRWYERATLRAMVAHGVVEAFRMSEEAATRLIHAYSKEIEPQSLRPTLDRWMSKYGVSVAATDVVEGMARSHMSRDGANAWSVVNAITQTAQGREDDERELLERVAGDMLATTGYGFGGGSHD